MKNKPKVIIVVDIGEASATIEEIKAILKDDYDNHEIVVVETDDPSIENLMINGEIIDYALSKSTPQNVINYEIEPLCDTKEELGKSQSIS